MAFSFEREDVAEGLFSRRVEVDLGNGGYDFVACRLSSRGVGGVSKRRGKVVGLKPLTIYTPGGDLSGPDSEGGNDGK